MEVEEEIRRWVKYFKQTTGNPSQSKELDEEGKKRSVWWHEFLIETGDIESDDTLYD